MEGDTGAIEEGTLGLSSRRTMIGLFAGWKGDISLEGKP